MFNKSLYSSLTRSVQINEFYCGPAVLQMLLSCFGFDISQDEIVNSVVNENKVKNFGITIEELGIAVKKLTPEYQLWYKHHSTLGDLSILVNVHKQPVGVEWQGVFDVADDDKEAESEGGDNDPGHYSIVTRIDTRQNVVTLLDPYHHYYKRDRRFTILEFERRWWDINEVVDPKTKKRVQQDDYHSMFIVTPNYEFWPEKVGMRRHE